MEYGAPHTKPPLSGHKTRKITQDTLDIEIVTCFSYFVVFLSFFLWLLTVVKVSISGIEDGCIAV